MQTAPLRALELQAQGRLPRPVYDFFAGGAEDEVTLRANEAAFARIGIVPRVLRACAPPQVGLTLLGQHLTAPVLVAPTAFHCLAHPEGERATARAAADCGMILIASMASTVSIEEVATAAREAHAGSKPGVWFQLYIQPDRAFTEAIIRRAEAAGCTALVVSVDSPVLGQRERDIRNTFHDLPEGLACENLREGASPGGRVRQLAFSTLTWSDIEWLRSVTRLKIVLKGIAHPEDARLAEAHGVDALIVSNHGGRQLDSMPAAIELLPPIVSVIAGRMPVLLDGGIRRGTDILKALALGATAIAVGRPVLWGLASYGEDGVRRVLTTLRAELSRAMTLCGCHVLGDLDGSLLRLPAGMASC
ncbi:MAG TPA: alpha-hydroxy acid oxidase [Steroidobacteraceae bacterium]|nr:alpha-hydroxy acid oxidase [Steroidobacteraceae bacterium]